MIWLMDFIGSPTLFGMELKPFPAAADKKNIIGSLEKKGILLRKGKQAPDLSPQIRLILNALFFPERALIVYRDLPGSGRQFFHALHKEKTTVLHSFPKEGEHAIRLIPQPAQLQSLFISWFPFFPLPITPAKFRIDRKIFERVRNLAGAGKSAEAINGFNPEGFDPEEKKKLIRAIAERKITGSIAWLILKEAKVEEGDSIALLTDGRSGWMMSQEDLPKSAGTTLTVERVGADIAMVFRGILEKLTGARLPRPEPDPSVKFVRFALSLDELAVSLALINCQELSQKMYMGLSNDKTGESYAERMKKAQQSLLDSKLCVVSDRGLPNLAENLAQAVFSIAKSDLMIQINASEGGAAIETGVYILRGRSFTIYRNYGERMQLLDFGKYADLPSQMESLFPGFGTEAKVQKAAFAIEFEKLNKAWEENPQEAEKILASEGIPEADRKLLLEDLSDSVMRAMLIRRDAPDRKKKDTENKEGRRPNALLLLKSSKRSWMFMFHAAGEKGTATVTDQEGFRKALADLIG